MTKTIPLSVLDFPVRLRRAFEAAVIVVLAASGGCSDPADPPASGSIRGTVTDDTGAVVANVAVGLTGSAAAARTTNSGANGVYTFADLRPGTYALTVTPPGGFTAGGSATASVTVASGAQADAPAFVLNRVTPTTGSIRGTVTDTTGVPVANAALALTGSAQAVRTANSAANGAYTFAGVSPGDYTVSVTPPAGFNIGTAAAASVTVAAAAQTDVPAFVLARMAPQEAADSAFLTALRARLANAAASQEFSGAVLVTRDGQTLFEGAYGLADRALGIPNTPLTQFRVGSMNKMLTAVAVLQLAQAGLVRLDVPFATYLPDYPNAEMASKVTLHHLLTHTGGTGDIFGPEFNANRLQLRDIDDYIQLYGTRDLKFEPGSWDYSNYGFILLGAVIERVSGMSYDDYIAARILAPAGMTATGAQPEDAVVPGRAAGYMWQGGALVSNAPTLPYRGTAAGGWYSTVTDFARFTRALREHRLLNQVHTEQLLSGKVQMGLSNPDIVKYAYGFIDRMQAGRRLVGHGGGAPGQSGELTFEPDGGYVIVVLSNFDPPAPTLIEAWILSNMPPN